MRVFAGFLWSFLFAAAGAAAGAGLERHALADFGATHHGALALTGLAAGLLLQSILREAGWLPGLSGTGRGGGLAIWLWGAGFMMAGCMAGYAIEHRFFPGMVHGHARGQLPLAGLLLGLLVFLVLRQRGIIGRRGGGLRWGVAQAVWLLAGFALMQIVGTGIFLFLALLLAHILAGIEKIPVTGAPNIVFEAFAGYLSAALFSLWYIGRLGPARLRDRSVTGIAWAPAPARAYGLAALFAGLIIISVVMIVHVFPPDLSKLKDLPNAKLFETSGLSSLLLVALAVFIAPPVEEYVFRGGIFAGLASRLSPFWAGVVTTILFMAVHAPDKIHYPPGFIDVGLMAAAAAWMRVKFGSIRPGILLHFLYNGGLMIAIGLAT